MYVIGTVAMKIKLFTLDTRELEWILAAFANYDFDEYSEDLAHIALLRVKLAAVQTQFSWRIIVDPEAG